MEYFTLCSKIIQKEKKKCNLDLQEIIRRTIEFSICDNFFESPYDRCAFMYKNATCIISFTKDCVCQYLQECPLATDMLLKWKDRPSLSFCSFSHGPALDYLSFCVAISENIDVSLQPSFDTVNVISNSAQWKHAIQFMTQSIKLGYLSSFPVAMFCDNFYVNQNPRLAFNEKQRTAVQEADVVFMVKTLNFSKTDEFEGRKKYFQNIISTMKADSYLFCMDTKPSISAMFDIFCKIPGQLIYGPVLNVYQLPEKFPENFKETYGCLPVVKARGNFFVWKKILLDLQVLNLNATNSEKLPTNPKIFIDNKVNEMNQCSPDVTVLKHIAAEFSDTCCANKKTIDLFNNENYTLLDKNNTEESKNINENLSTQLFFNAARSDSEDLKQILIGTSFDSVTSNKQNEVKTGDIEKSVPPNSCDQKFESASILDKLFSNLSLEKPTLSPTKTCFINDISSDTSIGINKERNKYNLQSQDLTDESRSLLTTPTYDFNIRSNSIDSSNFSSLSSMESPVIQNKDLNTTKSTERLPIPNFSSTILNGSSDSVKSKHGSFRTRRRGRRRGKKSSNASVNSKNTKILLSSTPVKVISSSVCALPISCNSEGMQNFCKNLNTNIENEVKLQSSVAKIHKSVSTNTDIDKSYADNCSTIQNLTNKIKTMVSNFDQILSGVTFGADKANKFSDNHLCHCLSVGKNVGNYDLYNNGCFQSSNIAPKEVCENLEKENKLNLEPKNFSLPQLSSYCFAQSGCHQYCEGKKEHGCAYTSTPCFHSAKQCVLTSDEACSKCMIGGQASPTVPNIVIPLQNITEDALTQILAILKVTNVHSLN